MGKTAIENKSLKTKSEFLGMSYGTACNKLRKQLLFKFVKKAWGGHIACWDCGSRITKVEDFTLQHKKPWLHEDESLFWDLRNITFSHARCNKPNRSRNAEKTHCPKGHKYSGKNLITRGGKSKGWRACRVCCNARAKVRMQEARAKNPKYGR